MTDSVKPWMALILRITYRWKTEYHTLNTFPYWNDFARRGYLKKPMTFQKLIRQLLRRPEIILFDQAQG
jgi:hypothetical protein